MRWIKALLSLAFSLFSRPKEKLLREEYVPEEFTTPTPTTTPVRLSVDSYLSMVVPNEFALAGINKAFVTYLNRLRAYKAVPPVIFDECCRLAAQHQAESMADKQQLILTGSRVEESSTVDRLRLYGNHSVICAEIVSDVGETVERMLAKLQLDTKAMTILTDAEFSGGDVIVGVGVVVGRDNKFYWSVVLATTPTPVDPEKDASVLKWSSIKQTSYNLMHPRAMGVIVTDFKEMPKCNDVPFLPLS